MKPLPLNADGIRPEVASAQEITILILAGLMFCGVPLFFLGLRVARRFRLTQGRVLLVGVLAGAALMMGLLRLFPDGGQLFAASAAPAFFYGVWYGGRENEQKIKQKRSGGKRGSRSAQNAWGTKVAPRKTSTRK